MELFEAAKVDRVECLDTQKVLSSKHGENVPPILSPAHVCPSEDDMGDFPTVPEVSLGTLGSRKVYNAGHERRLSACFPGCSGPITQ